MTHPEQHFLAPLQSKELLKILQSRFEKNMYRHEGIQWTEIEAKINATPGKIWSLHEMERTGGEPDVVIFHRDSVLYAYADCSVESPRGRRSLCYDAKALESRKEHKPKHSAEGMAQEMGIQLLTEELYRKLQEFGGFDTKTSSWIQTPDRIRNLGGALFGDRRYSSVFIYHNGAESYYAARGFRGYLDLTD